MLILISRSKHSLQPSKKNFSNRQRPIQIATNSQIAENNRLEFPAPSDTSSKQPLFLKATGEKEYTAFVFVVLDHLIQYSIF